MVTDDYRVKRAIRGQSALSEDSGYRVAGNFLVDEEDSDYEYAAVKEAYKVAHMDLEL